ncbi:ATP-sensitive inward rectifier potassium channel 12 [Harpegnathos saltator]|uniref:ATP-sensitive inward rectifier potassium channel 12 n=1 Tax=Harpegnathos saltator TaxID=610380 RepID=E2BHE4_HARSA|nr:ATP-sensitive inward rectifier potassium channel 12 [Harpegnathos saltator]
MNGINGNVPKMSDKSSSSPDCGEEQKLLPTTPTTPMILQVTKNPYSYSSFRSRYRAGPTRKLRRRAVLKNGDCNVLQSRISRRSLRFLQDIFTTLVDTQWRWTLMCFILSFFLSWLGFAVIWWLIAFTHGDFEERHLPPYQVENNWTPCVYNIFSFTSCFLFSIETQHTIGYGSRSTTEECPEAIFVMCIQSIAGVMIQAFMVGIVFAKMTRPKQRTQTLLFSRNAVICQRDGELCLMFRVGDMRKSHIIGATVRAQLIRNRTTKEGEILSQNQQELIVGTDGQNGDLFFIWPTTIIHRINEESPFYNMSAEDMLTDRFEVVLILEGTIESTGQTTQARSSYLPQEILWGHRFDPMVSYSKERQGYEVDYSLFDSTTQVDTPLCSGKELAEFYRVQDDLRHGTDGGLRRVPSEPKSAPTVLDTLSRAADSTGFHLVHQGHSSSQEPPKLHIDIPSIDDCSGV